MVRLEGLVDSGELTGPVGPQGEQGELGPQGEQGPQFTMVRTWRDLPTMVVSGKDIVDNIIGKIGTHVVCLWVFLIHVNVCLQFREVNLYI